MKRNKPSDTTPGQRYEAKEFGHGRSQMETLRLVQRALRQVAARHDVEIAAPSRVLDWIAEAIDEEIGSS